jgi:hypothetical protein
MILSLHSIRLNAPLNTTGESLLLTELILPRNAIARKAALKDIRLTKGTRSFARAPFYETGLLKEKVEGPFGLKVHLTRPLRHPEFSRFLRQILATGVDSSVDLLTSVFATAPGTAVLGDLAEEAADQLSDSLADTTPSFIAVGGIDLQSEGLENGRITIPLKLIESVRQSDQPPGPRARENRRAAQLFRKGSPVGEIQLDLQG